MKTFCRTLPCFLLLLASCASGPDRLANRIPAQLIPASDARFRYEGRFDFADTNAPVAIWQASRIRLDFDGDTLGLRFDGAKGQCFFDVRVNGSNTVVALREGQPASAADFSGLGPGRHSVVIFKRSEANAGTARFRGVELATDAAAWSPAPPPYRLRMEFIGDSITAGACNEDGDADQWEDRGTHNAAASYAALTAAAFQADHRNLAVSGMGIATGWVPQTAGEVWDRLYPQPSPQRADLEAWQPHVVLVNLGENDDSFTRSKRQLFPMNFAEGYVALVRAIRAARPDARIVLLRGGMFGGAQSEPLRNAWQAAVAQLEASDPAVSHFVFKHWSQNHPRVAEHRAMADELVAWLRQQEFMKLIVDG